MAKYTEYLIYMGNNHFKPINLEENILLDFLQVITFGLISSGSISADTGTWGIHPSSFVSSFNKLNTDIKATAKSVHPNHTPAGMGVIPVTQQYRENLLQDIKNSIKNDTPVTILYLFNNAKWYNYDEYLLSPRGDRKWNHYVNATEVIIDEIAGEVILTISNWGNKHQIIWSEFVNAYEFPLGGNRVIFYY